MINNDVIEYWLCRSCQKNDIYRHYVVSMNKAELVSIAEEYRKKINVYRNAVVAGMDKFPEAFSTIATPAEANKNMIYACQEILDSFCSLCCELNFLELLIQEIGDEKQVESRSIQKAS